MLLGCLKTLQRPYQILDWYWALAFLWQNNNIAKCADGRDGKPHSKGSKFLVSKCLYCFSPDWLEKPPHSSHFPKWYWKRHQKPFVRQMSCRSWEKVAVKIFLNYQPPDAGVFHYTRKRFRICINRKTNMKSMKITLFMVSRIYQLGNRTWKILKNIIF